MDINNHVFCIINNDKILNVDNELADHVILPIMDYEELLVSEEMLISPELVLINKKELNGLKNSLRIVRNKSLQQVDKAKADSHGYTLKYCEKRKIDSDYDECSYYITKDTPHSIKIPIEDASELIKRDLIDFYNYIEFPEFVSNSGINYRKRLTNREIILANIQMQSKDYAERDFVLDNSSWGRNVKKFFSNIANKNFIFDITKFTADYGKGTYQVSYLSTGPI